MKWAIISAAAISIGLAGCGSSKKSAGIPASESVTDISAPPAPVAPFNPGPQPVAQPVVYDNMTAAAPGSIASGNYTVKKGDTLYSIAKGRFGDGKQWTKIVSANPGLKPEALKVGQTIAIP